MNISVFKAKKVVLETGWIDGWVDVKVVLRVAAYSNLKCPRSFRFMDNKISLGKLFY